MKFELVFLDTVDPSLGRLDYTSLSQQALMEVVIEGITNKEKICGDADEPKDIEKWKGVEIEDGEVVAMDWHEFDIGGSLHLEWLPSSVRDLVANGNQLTADPMDGHLYVVGRISTPSWGKPGAARYYGDPPWGHRAETRVSTILHCHGILDSVANKNEAANNDIKNQKTKNQTTRNQKTKNQENKKQKIKKTKNKM